MKILLVDDEKDLRESISELVELETGFKVHQARNGIEALSLCQDLIFDFLVVDFRMPKMNGADFLKKLVEENNPNSQSQILFLSGFVEEIKLQLEGNFQINYKSKPISPIDLLQFFKRLS